MPKPKNEGQILTVRVSTETHAIIARALSVWAAEGRRPSERTKAKVIEEAMVMYSLYEIGPLGTLGKSPDALPLPPMTEGEWAEAQKGEKK